MISLVLKLCLIGNCTGWSFRSRNILCKGFEMKSVSCFLFFLRLIGYWRNYFPQYISPQLNLQLKIEECEYEHRGRQRLNNESWKKFYSTINWQLSSVSGQTSWKYARMEIICPRNRRTKTLIDSWGGTNSMRAHRTRWELTYNACMSACRDANVSGFCSHFNWNKMKWFPLLKCHGMEIHGLKIPVHVCGRAYMTNLSISARSHRRLIHPSRLFSSGCTKLLLL